MGHALLLALLLPGAALAEPGARAAFVGVWRDGGPPAWMTIDRPQDLFPDDFRPYTIDEGRTRKLTIPPDEGSEVAATALGFHGLQKAWPSFNDRALEFTLSFKQHGLSASFRCKPPEGQRLTCIVLWVKYERIDPGPGGTRPHDLAVGRAMERYILLRP